jgi:hypothetical protein
MLSIIFIFLERYQALNPAAAMRFPRWLYLLTFFLLPQSYLSAQGNADIKYGKITAPDFAKTRFIFNSHTQAVSNIDMDNISFLPGQGLRSISIFETA